MKVFQPKISRKQQGKLKYYSNLNFSIKEKYCYTVDDGNLIAEFAKYDKRKTEG